MGDFLLRLAFFAAAPIAIVLLANLFPVRGALIDVALALGVFSAGESLRRRAANSRVLSLALKEALAFESFYRSKPPRPFAYYFFYPLLFPYWLSNREARHEFLMFRGYTLVSFLLLVVQQGWQYYSSYLPELGLREFLPALGLSLGVETLVVLSLLMPIATTVVWYHSSFRRGRLLAVLLVGLVSSGFAIARIVSHRDPIVSYLTRQRVVQRTKADRKHARTALFAALSAAWRELYKEKSIPGDGKVEGKALDDARTALEPFYKHDEAFAFDLWASPRGRPHYLVLYCESRGGRPPIWVGLKDGAEIRKTAQLPRGAFLAMREAADTANALDLINDDD
ncbi:MAG TPA: hypothetical protein VGI10_09230 [Polyangiaceae bacterium]|jgi:hypothetical protein